MRVTLTIVPLEVANFGQRSIPKSDKRKRSPGLSSSSGIIYSPSVSDDPFVDAFRAITVSVGW